MLIRKHRLLVGLAFGCIALVVLSVLTYRHHRVDQASSDDGMYEVYSTAIRELFLNEADETKSPDDLGTRLVVIKDHTISYPGNELSDPTKRALGWGINGVGCDKRTVEDFKRKCKDSMSLEPHFALPGNQALISDEQLHEFFSGNGSSWQGFYKTYPKSVGYIFLSRVGFNPEHDQAFLYIGISCGGLCGEGYYVLLGRDAGIWSVKHKDELWVS